VTGQVHTPEEIGNIVIKTVDNVPVRVQDIGAVAPAVEPVYTAVSANGKARSAPQRQSATRQQHRGVADEVHQEMAAIQPTLPAGVEMRPFYDQSNIVNESIASVRDAIIVGLFLAGLIIWLFLRDWGTAVMTGLVVPVTMVDHLHHHEVLGRVST
jgi:multidrug efflux pump subunit AcrB